MNPKALLVCGEFAVMLDDLTKKKIRTYAKAYGVTVHEFLREMIEHLDVSNPTEVQVLAYLNDL